MFSMTRVLEQASHLEVVEWLAAKANTRPVSESKQANAGLGRNEVAWKRLLMHRVDLPFLFHADGHRFQPIHLLASILPALTCSSQAKSAQGMLCHVTMAGKGARPGDGSLRPV